MALTAESLEEWSLDTDMLDKTGLRRSFYRYEIDEVQQRWLVDEIDQHNLTDRSCLGTVNQDVCVHHPFVSVRKERSLARFVAVTVSFDAVTVLTRNQLVDFASSPWFDPNQVCYGGPSEDGSCNSHCWAANRIVGSWQSKIFVVVPFHGDPPVLSRSAGIHHASNKYLHARSMPNDWSMFVRQRVEDAMFTPEAAIQNPISGGRWTHRVGKGRVVSSVDGGKT